VSERTLYDRLGTTYTATRREDPRIAAAIHAALGDAVTVVNVGAGTGSYEPADRRLVATESSRGVIAQRPPTPPRRSSPAPRTSRSPTEASTRRWRS
jgi:hypothetical protein